MTVEHTQSSVMALTPRQVAERLGLSEWTVRNLIRQGEIPAIKFGRNWRVPVAALDELMAKAAAS